jgi:hypothetical protein
MAGGNKVMQDKLGEAHEICKYDGPKNMNVPKVPKLLLQELGR